MTPNACSRPWPADPAAYSPIPNAHPRPLPTPRPGPHLDHLPRRNPQAPGRASPGSPTRTCTPPTTPKNSNLAERHTAELNEAYQLLLSDDIDRSRLAHHPPRRPPRIQNPPPRPFLMEVMEWNETLDERGVGHQPRSPSPPQVRGTPVPPTPSPCKTLRTLLDPLPEKGSPSPANRGPRNVSTSIRYLHPPPRSHPKPCKPPKRPRASPIS